MAAGLGGWCSRGYLPHFDASEKPQMSTFRVFDSVPQQVLDRWKQELAHLSEEERNLGALNVLKLI